VRRDGDENPIIDPLVLSILLRSDFVFGQIMHQVAGIGRPRIAVKDLKQIRIPLPSPEVQRALRQAYLKTQQTYSNLKKQAEQLIRRAESMEKQAVENVALGLCVV
jgi:restriction endonuclease S subunit